MVSSASQIGLGHHGSFQFREEIRLFADNELGSGSEVELEVKVKGKPAQIVRVRITWCYWNWFNYVVV